MNNLDIRLLVDEAGIKYQKIAEEMGISPEWLSRLMGKPLSSENRLRIMEAINEVVQKDGDCINQKDGDCINREVFEQVKWERDVALEQLEELGYSLGEKIRTDEDCISREAAVYIAKHECNHLKIASELERIPPAKQKVDADALINKIETDLSWDMFDEFGNSSDFHDQLVGIIREVFGEVSK